MPAIHTLMSALLTTIIGALTISAAVLPGVPGLGA
jgi:hypothetical protein